MRSVRFTLILSLLFCISLFQQVEAQFPETEREIREVLGKQQQAWNAGDLEGFMEGYWKSDSLQFIGRKIRHGWQETLEGYRKGYPDKAAMGRLAFEIWQVVPLTDETWLVSGKYTLYREKDEPSGAFTLIFKKKAGKWVIVYDHTG